MKNLNHISPFLFLSWDNVITQGSLFVPFPLKAISQNVKKYGRPLTLWEMRVNAHQQPPLPHPRASPEAVHSPPSQWRTESEVPCPRIIWLRMFFFIIKTYGDGFYSFLPCNSILAYLTGVVVCYVISKVSWIDESTVGMTFMPTRVGFSFHLVVIVIFWGRQRHQVAFLKGHLKNQANIKICRHWMNTGWNITSVFFLLSYIVHMFLYFPKA